MKYVKIKNLNYDYQHYVEQEGLFSIAFFGNNGTKQQVSKLNYIWKQLLKQYKGIK
jgi:hypothetical protein|tara:strand:- start:71 stop:238 length:168 start_codon:yes stop_codon:yes gene_type:complete